MRWLQTPARLGMIRTSMILLVLLASLPQLLCCCNVSWGASGLFGRPSLCGGHEVRPQHCCCCKPAENDLASTAQRETEECRCTFSVVNPPPMAGHEKPALEIGFFVPLTVSFASITSVVDHSTLPVRCDGWPPSLSPPDRCALFQIWRA